MSTDHRHATHTQTEAGLSQRVAQLEHALATTRARLQQETAQRQHVESALRETQNELIAQQKLASLGAMTAGIAHEMRNPLNFVMNFAELAMELIQELREVFNHHRSGFEASALTGGLNAWRQRYPEAPIETAA